MIAPITVQIQSEKYSSVSYTVYVNSFDPEPGTLNYALLRHNVNVSCYINVIDSLLDDYEYAIITLAYKQTRTKSKRYKSLLRHPHLSNVLYRDNLEVLLTEYKKVMLLDDSIESKALLLNAECDNMIGDTGIQCMFRLKRFDGASEFALYPGATIHKLVSIIGLSVFEADSVEEVIDLIILDMSNLMSEHVLPFTGLNNTPELNSDIKRYLKFSFCGE